MDSEWSETEEESEEGTQNREEDRREAKIKGFSIIFKREGKLPNQKTEFDWNLPLPFPPGYERFTLQKKKNKEKDSDPQEIREKRNKIKLELIFEWLHQCIPRTIRDNFEFIVMVALFDWEDDYDISEEEVNDMFQQKMQLLIREKQWFPPKEVRDYYNGLRFPSLN